MHAWQSCLVSRPRVVSLKMLVQSLSSEGDLDSRLSSAVAAIAEAPVGEDAKSFLDVEDHPAAEFETERCTALQELARLEVQFTRGLSLRA